MKRREDFQDACVAALPLFALALGPAQKTMEAACAVLLFWGTPIFFEAAEKFFPKKLFQFSIAAWMAVWAQAAWYLTRIPPVWLVSALFLLAPFRQKTARFWERPLLGKGEIRRGIFFIAIAAVLLPLVPSARPGPFAFLILVSAWLCLFDRRLVESARKSLIVPEKVLRLLVSETAILAGALIMLAAFAEGLRRIPSGFLMPGEAAPLLAAAVSFLAARIFQKERAFLGALLAFSFSLVFESSFVTAVKAALLAAAGTGLLRALMQAVRFRLLFAPIPVPFQGLPAAVFSFLMLALSLHGFRSLLGF